MSDGFDSSSRAFSATSGRSSRDGASSSVAAPLGDLADTRHYGLPRPLADTWDDHPFNVGRPVTLMSAARISNYILEDNGARLRSLMSRPREERDNGRLIITGTITLETSVMQDLVLLATLEYDAQDWIMSVTFVPERPATDGVLNEFQLPASIIYMHSRQRQTKRGAPPKKNATVWYNRQKIADEAILNRYNMTDTVLKAMRGVFMLHTAQGSVQRVSVKSDGLVQARVISAGRELRSGEEFIYAYTRGKHEEEDWLV